MSLHTDSMPPTSTGDLWEQVADALPDGILLLESTGRIRAANRSAARMLGVTHDTMPGMSFVALTQSSTMLTGQHFDASAWLATIASTPVTSSSFFTIHYIRPDGTPTTLSLYLTSLFTTKLFFLRISEVQGPATPEFYEWLRRAVILAPLPTMLHAENGEVLLVNQAWLDLTGYTREELSTISAWLALAYGPDAKRMQAKISRLYRTGGRIHRGEFTITTRGGEQRVWDCSSSALGALPDGRRIALSMADDVTDRVRTEAALRASEARWQLALRGSADVIWEWDIATGAVTLSDRWTDFSGYPPEETPTTIEELIASCHPDDAPRIDAALHAHLRGETPYYEIEHRVRRYDGNYRWIACRAIAERDAAGNPTRMAGSEIDIDDRKRMEERLARSRDYYLTLFEHFPALIWRAGVDGGCDYFNATWLTFTGRTLEQEQGDGWAVGVHPDDLEYCLQHYQDAFTARRLFEMEYRLRRSDGEYRWIHDIGRPIYDVDGEFAGYVGSCYDVTEKRRIVQEMQRAEKLESVGLLAGGIAHDFNNLLAAILGNITLARMRIDDESPAAQRLDEAEQVALRAKGLTQQLLTFAKGGTPIKQVVTLNRVLQESTGFARISAHICCTVDMPHTLWPVEVDEGQIDQVLSNLVINAVQAMPDGGTITVQAANVTLTGEELLPLSAGPHVRIAVTDSGPGISPENIERIFDPFYTTKPQGNGLGLATAYSIMKAHGGHITVASVLREGTTFTLYLPALPAATPATQEDSATPCTGEGRVLVLDDDPTLRELVCEMLTSLGYHAVAVADGTDVLAQYQQALCDGQPFDLVIMDLTIPAGMGGKEAMVHLRAIDPKVRAIVSSGYATDPIMASYRLYGFCGVLCKPYSLGDLGQILTRILTFRDDQ